jgi:hypothetical protein
MLGLIGGIAIASATLGATLVNVADTFPTISIDYLTDKKYYEIVQTSGPGVFKAPAPPITFGARVSAHF